MIRFPEKWVWNVSHDPWMSDNSGHRKTSVNLLKHFTTLPDPRVERTKRHPLLDIIGLAICAVICGADGWEAIEEYGNTKETW